MKLIVFILIVFFNYIDFVCNGQTFVNGKVTNENGEGIFAANVYFKKNITSAVPTDFDGNFQINVKDKSLLEDTLVISFIGYNTKYIDLKKVTKYPINIVLKNSTLSMQEVYISSKRPIAENFSVTKLNKIDIYLDPSSSGDPLKALTSFPFSTNTDESANPSLRGSSPNRSKVVFNGVPIYNPVRNSQINGMGNFSLFNTEIIENMLVFPSNPPLTIGNTSAGLVEIETENSIEKDKISFSDALASTGFFLSKRLNKYKSSDFIQLYSNYQFPKLFLGLNKKSFDYINDFKTIDAGLNFHKKIDNYSSLNFFSYGIDESFNLLAHFMTSSANMDKSQKRNFNVLNYRYWKGKELITFNTGTNISKSLYYFGNIGFTGIENQLYSSINYKHFFSDNISSQIGVTYDYNKTKMNGKTAIYYYALSDTSPTNNLDTSMVNRILEYYMFNKISIANNKIILGIGIRKNFAFENQISYLSYQGSLRYTPDDYNTFLLSGGKYHSYSIANQITPAILLLKAIQSAFEYELKFKATSLHLAGYLKKEYGSEFVDFIFSSNYKQSLGIEFFCEQTIMKNFKISIANTYLDVTYNKDDSIDNSPNSLKYFIKGSIEYQNPKFFNLSLNCIANPGSYYTPITSAYYIDALKVYKPVYSNKKYSAYYNGYKTFNCTINKNFVLLKKFPTILYFTVTNIFNSNNEKTVYYNTDYTQSFFDDYQKRMYYFGLIINFYY